MIHTQTKNKVLKRLAVLLSDHALDVIDANKKDVRAYLGGDASMLDRLKVDEKKVQGMISSVNDGIALEDPEGKVLYTHDHDNGLFIENKTVPFGNILIIYESRPDVTIEAALTAFKAGNKILLKGGKEARNTNLVLTDLWHKALKANGISESYVTYLDINREESQRLIKENTHNVDLIIPRGGEGLINFVRQNTDIPVIVSGRGNNFLYVGKDADFGIAIDLIVNGKQRISVCNALDKVIIHQAIPQLNNKLADLIVRLKSEGIEVLAERDIAETNDGVAKVEDESIWYEEFLAPKIMITTIDSIEKAISMINKYSGGHSATIVGNDEYEIQQFMDQVDCAAVYHNASTRFTDGGQFGFGAEMAISTQKVHFRGPVGIGQLVTNKWFIYGSGQTRP